MDYSPKKTNQFLQSNNFNIKKKFGQNFIIDENIINNIVSKAEIDETTLVIEIGPGAGALTHKLSLIAKQVICFEIDEALRPILNKNITSENVEIFYEDFLKTDVKNKLNNYNYDKLYVVANLPYYITTPILLKIVEELEVDKIVVMVQKEVGNRLKAKPNSKDYNSLSIYLQYYFDITKLMDVSRNVFMPAPNVDSIVVSFTKKEITKVNEKIFFQLVRDSFKQKRKTLKNNLFNYDLIKIEQVLIKYGFNLSVRAEQLAINIFIDIANSL